MDAFNDFKLKKLLARAVDDLGFASPTPIQAAAYPVILSGKDMLGIAQTGTGKTLAYLLPVLQDLKYSDQLNPRVLIVVPTRELVTQVVTEIETLTRYMSVRTIGIFGGVNINTQRKTLLAGADILVATPRRLYDLVLSQNIALKSVKKLVIDEVDVMLDLGFLPQLTNIMELLPKKRQNILFSATMTDPVSDLIDAFFVVPERISIAVSGTPLENIAQECYPVQNFYTKINLLKHLLTDRDEFKKVLVFVGSKSHADRIFREMEEEFSSQLGIIHSNKSQNFRSDTIAAFSDGLFRVLIATDVIARGLDLEGISHVINFDTPSFPENYMHRIGRTGRAKEQGKALLFYTEKEMERKNAIEALMDCTIPVQPFPSTVKISKELLLEERPPEMLGMEEPTKHDELIGKGFHEKKEKNKKVNLGGSYKREIAKKYKKPKTRGDKNKNRRKKR